jgi:hypothetical protein
MANLSDLLGKTLTHIFGGVDDDTLVFRTSDGKTYQMYHRQDCCESVSVESIVGDLEDLIGEPLLRAEEECNADPGPDAIQVECDNWTFYKLATRKGYVDIRWFGTSNGYYSTSVDFEEF